MHPQPARILVVETESSVRERTALLLTEAGYEVVTAAEVRQALALLARQRVDVILLDLALPGGRGWAFFTRARAAAPGTWIVPVGAADRARAFAARYGAPVFLKKPFERAHLLAVVGGLTARGPAAPAAEPAQQPELFGLGRLFWQMTDAVIAAEAGSGAIVLWNPAAAALFGYSAREALALTIDTFVPDRLRAAHRAGRLRYASEKVAPRMAAGEVVRATALQRGGTEIEIELTLNPLADASVPGDYVLAIVRDISERARRERERERLLLLEQQARALLQATSEEQEAFVYTVSHDLRVPLISIRGMAAFLKADAGARLSEEQRFCLERIEANARHMQALLDDLLTLARAGREPDERRATPLLAAVQAAREQLASQLLQRQATLDVGTPLPAVDVSEPRLIELFVILLDNALRYTPLERAPRIRIEAQVQEATVACRVSDNGVGISPAQRQRALTLFQRLPAGTALSPEGSGAGLAIAQRIVTARGGRLWIEDAPDGGARICFTLPLASAS